MTDTPEQWAYDEADRRGIAASNLATEFARMIQQYESHLRPADPDEAIAAEACAQTALKFGFNPMAEAYRAGEERGTRMFLSALRAIKLSKESVS